MKHAYFFMPLLAVLACQPNTQQPMPTPKEASFARGVNSIQLIKTQEGWRVTRMAWNDDNRGDGFFERMEPSH